MHKACEQGGQAVQREIINSASEPSRYQTALGSPRSSKTTLGELALTLIWRLFTAYMHDATEICKHMLQGSVAFTKQFH